MNAELDYDLSLELWDALKALRNGATQGRAPNRFAIEQLAALGLAATSADGPMITPVGHKVLIRGSSQLWEDVAA
jgi:ribosomal protein S19E (S16A)